MQLFILCIIIENYSTNIYAFQDSRHLQNCLEIDHIHHGVIKTHDAPFSTY